MCGLKFIGEASAYGIRPVSYLGSFGEVRPFPNQLLLHDGQGLCHRWLLLIPITESDSTTSRIWEMFMAAVVLYTAIFIPVQAHLHELPQIVCLPWRLLALDRFGVGFACWRWISQDLADGHPCETFATKQHHAVLYPVMRSRAPNF